MLQVKSKPVCGFSESDVKGQSKSLHAWMNCVSSIGDEVCGRVVFKKAYIQAIGNHCSMSMTFRTLDGGALHTVMLLY